MSIQQFPLVIQTAYAELLDLLRTQHISSFPPGTTFRRRTVNNRPYWYAQEPTTPSGRKPERYLGADTPELERSITQAKKNKQSLDARKTIVTSLLSVGMPAPDPLTARLLERLVHEGFFRLRGVLVGSVAFQAYSGLLGIKLPGSTTRTGDLDLAQDYGVSLALDDALSKPILNILLSVDEGFTAIPGLTPKTPPCSFATPHGYRVDILTTNRGADTDHPVRLPSMHVDALPLRHLDFLLRHPVQAALLTRQGLLVTVPSPSRYAIHKLILGIIRQTGAENIAKASKDIRQAEILITGLLAAGHGHALKEAYHEAQMRGQSWQKKIQQGINQLPQQLQNELIAYQVL